MPTPWPRRSWPSTGSPATNSNAAVDAVSAEVYPLLTALDETSFPRPNHFRETIPAPLRLPAPTALHRELKCSNRRTSGVSGAGFGS
jgi:hypothetical protein